MKAKDQTEAHGAAHAEDGADQQEHREGPRARRRGGAAGRVDAGEAAARFDRAVHEGRAPDLADKEQAEIAILNAYLPASASDDEIAAAVTAAIAETGATSAKDMGKVMKAVMAGLAGKTVDGKKVSEAVKAKLG